MACDLANTFKKLQHDLGVLIGEVAASGTTADLSTVVSRSARKSALQPSKWRQRPAVWICAKVDDHVQNSRDGFGPLLRKGRS